MCVTAVRGYVYGFFPRLHSSLITAEAEGSFLIRHSPHTTASGFFESRSHREVSISPSRQLLKKKKKKKKTRAEPKTTRRK